MHADTDGVVLEPVQEGGREGEGGNQTTIKLQEEDGGLVPMCPFGGSSV